MTPPHRKQTSAIERLLPGQISYLKKRTQCNQKDLLRTNISEGCFGHPILILSTNKPKAEVEALTLTSFGGISLEEKHPRSRHIRLLHLPIDPAPRHPDNGILLHLNGNLRLPKKTYIKAETPYRIPWSMLRPWHCDSQRRKVLEGAESAFIFSVAPIYGIPDFPLSLSASPRHSIPYTPTIKARTMFKAKVIVIQDQYYSLYRWHLWLWS